MNKVIHIIIYIFAIIGLLFTGVFFAMKLGLTNAESGVESVVIEENSSKPIYDTKLWQESEEWQVFSTAIVRDKELIKKTADKIGISPRLIMSVAAVEQLRLFYNERAVFEEIFSPLKILGVQSQFSWGVMGMKQETAMEIEKRDKNNILAFSTNDPDSERFERLTHPKDSSWSYLYAGLFMKQVMDEWKVAGYSIDDNPGVIATLYNIGFANSKPKENPQLGGAIIEFKGRDYTFGSLAHDIYYSDELIDLFPIE